jgi:hypothetical protein
MMEDKSKKWWLIGCGGCLGVLVIISAALAVLAGMGVNALKEGSNGAVANIFGKSFQPVGYMPIGIPLGAISKRSEVQNMVMLIDSSNHKVIFALDMPVSPSESMVFKSHDAKGLNTYFKQIGNTLISYSARGSSSGGSKFKDLTINASHFAKLPNGKEVPVSSAIVEMEQRGNKVYSPAAVALIPEAGSRKIALFALGGNGAVPSGTGLDFKPGQRAMEKELLDIILASELDDRLRY